MIDIEDETLNKAILACQGAAKVLIERLADVHSPDSQSGYISAACQQLCDLDRGLQILFGFRQVKVNQSGG
jgi:hypothetical protein